MAKTSAQYFSKDIDGEPFTQVAHTAADAVRMTYDGWRDVTAEVQAAQASAKQAAKADAAATSSTASKSTK